MGKKVYKKKKKIIETVIYQGSHPRKKLSFSTLLSVFFIFLISLFLYYLSFIFPPQNNTNNQAKNNNMARVNDSRSTSLTINIQSYLLHTKKNSKALVSEKSLYIDTQTYPQDQIIWHGSRNNKEIALTFDADITPIMVGWVHNGQIATYDDARITNYLIQNNIKATFFLTGLWIQLYPDATKELADNSLFELENHSYSHPSMAGYCFDQPQIPISQYPYEIEKTQQLIKQYTHVVPKYFRFPGGCYDQADLNLVKKEGLVTVHWDDVADDGFNNNEEQIIHNVLSEARPGGIIVMHIGSPQSNVPQTANTLPTIINELKKEGYIFVTVSELLNPPVIATKLDPKKYLSSLESFTNFTP